MSPSDLEVLIHCHCIPGAHPRLHAPAVQDAIQKFLDNGIIARSGGLNVEEYSTTARGRAWLEMILRTPMPTDAWIDPRTKEVIER